MSSCLISKRLFLILLLLWGWSLSAEQYCLEGLPNVSSRSEICESNWVVSADFLAWFASEEIASIWADVIHVAGNTASWGAPSFDFNWDYGFRVGTGYDLIHDQWDTAFFWTWFRSSATHRLFADAGTSISPEFFAGFLSGDKPESMKVQWSLLFNMFDWELARSFWVSEGLLLRPFIGLKGGWIDQSIHGHYENFIVNQIVTTESGHEHLENNFWGVGPSGGVNSKWKIGTCGSHFFDLFGDFSLATMWGSWKNSDVYENSLAQVTSVDTKNSALAALMFRALLGFGWDADFREGRSHIAAKLGYEMQLWSNQLRIATFQLQRLQSDLTLQGITFNCRLDF